MEQTLPPLPYLQPNPAVLARIRQFARTYQPACSVLLTATTTTLCT